MSTEPATGTASGIHAALARIVEELSAEGGTVHLLADDGLLHLEACVPEMPPQVLDLIRTIEVGKGMAGLAVERRAPVDACNLQTDDSGDVRPGAKMTGLKGAIVVPILRGEAVIGALGVGNQEERTFTEDEIARLDAVGREMAAIG